MTNAPLKYVASINDDKLDENTSPDRPLRYVDISAVTEGRIRAPIAEVTFAEAPSRARRLARTGDVVVSTVRTYLRAVAPVDESLSDCVWSTGFAVLRPRSVEPKYLCYAVLTSDFLDEVVARSVGVSYPAINPGDLGGIRVPVPPRSKQRMIAGFLDTETARIDALVEARNKQRMLAFERYAAQRDGIFESAGQARPLGLTMRVLRGTTFPDRYQGNSSGDLPFAKVADLSRDGNAPVVVGAENWITRSVASELKATVIPRGAVIFPRVGMAMMSNPRRFAGRDLVIDDNQLALVLTEHGDPRYAFHWMSTVDLVAQSNPGAVPSVTDASLKRLRIPWASPDEQRRIADVLDQEAARVSVVDGALRRSIALLRERRQALITAAVSGRVDVGG